MKSKPTPAAVQGSTVARWVFAAVLGMAGSGAAMAQTQTQAQCDQQTNLGVNAQLRVSQSMGRALVELTKPNSAGRKVEIEYGDEMYSFKMGSDSRLRAGFALTAATNSFTINMSETAPITCEVAVPDFNKMYRVILRWRDPVQLDLNVIEPGGRLSLVLKTTACLFVGSLRVRQDLERNDTVEHGIAGLEDRPHTAAANKLKQLEMIQFLAGEQLLTQTVGRAHRTTFTGPRGRTLSNVSDVVFRWGNCWRRWRRRSRWHIPLGRHRAGGRLN